MTPAPAAPPSPPAVAAASPAWQALPSAVPAALLVALSVASLVLPAETVSEVENRRLAAWPSCDRADAWSGRCGQQIDAYVADHVPGREWLARANFALRAAWGWRRDGVRTYEVAAGEAGIERSDDWAPLAEDASEALDADDLATFDEPVSAASATTRLADDDSPAAAGEAAPTATADRGELAPHSTPAAPSPAPGPALGPAAARAGEPVRKPKPPPLHSVEGILIVDGWAIQPFGGTAGMVKGWTRAVNALRATLPPSVRVFGLLAPSAGEFHLPEGHRRRVRAERPVIEAAYQGLAAGVVGVDAHAELARHAGEAQYFRTDHHWTARGAYRAYAAVARAAGVRVAALESFRRVVWPRYLGSLYGLTADPSLRERPDELEVFVPPFAHRAVHYERVAPTRAVPSRFVREKARTYGSFLGADFPLMVGEVDHGSGRRVLLLKNSYGNPFAVWLLASFDKVVVVDYRYFQGDLGQLVAEHAITDVIALNGIFSACTRYHQLRMMTVARRAQQGAAARAKASLAPLPAAATPATAATPPL